MSPSPTPHYTNSSSDDSDSNITAVVAQIKGKRYFTPCAATSCLTSNYYLFFLFFSLLLINCCNVFSEPKESEQVTPASTPAELPAPFYNKEEDAESSDVSVTEADMEQFDR